MTELMEDGSGHGGAPASGAPDPAPNANPSVFSCAQCRTIIADSAAVVDMHEKYGVVMVNDANNIHIDKESPTMSRDGFDAMTVFFEVFCSECRHALGRQYFCTPAHMDCYRNLFTFSAKALSIYTFGSNQGALPLSESAACRDGVFTFQDARRQYERISEIVVILLERLDAIEGTLQPHPS